MRTFIATAIVTTAFVFAAPAYADCSGHAKTATQTISKPLTTPVVTTDSVVKTPVSGKTSG